VRAGRSRVCPYSCAHHSLRGNRFRALGETIRAIRAIRKISINFDKFDPTFGKISIYFDRRLGKFGFFSNNFQ